MSIKEKDDALIASIILKKLTEYFEPYRNEIYLRVLFFICANDVKRNTILENVQPRVRPVINASDLIILLDAVGQTIYVKLVILIQVEMLK